MTAAQNARSDGPSVSSGHSVPPNMCERCQGKGQVMAYRGIPTWINPIDGRGRVMEIARGAHSDVLSSCRDRSAAARLLFDAKTRSGSFTAATCPDCRGRGHHIVEQIGAIVPPTADGHRYAPPQDPPMNEHVITHEKMRGIIDEANEAAMRDLFWRLHDPWGGVFGGGRRR